MRCRNLFLQPRKMNVASCKMLAFAARRLRFSCLVCRNRFQLLRNFTENTNNGSKNANKGASSQSKSPKPVQDSSQIGASGGSGSMSKGGDQSAENISSRARHLTSDIQHIYEEIEKSMMHRINESNTRRFRLVLLSIVCIAVGVIAVFGERIRHRLVRETADIAQVTLENEKLKVQTKALAMAVVETVLNDENIKSHAAAFLRDASTQPETQQALLDLTVHVLQHPDSLEQLKSLAKKLIDDLCKDEETVEQFGLLLANAVQNPVLVSALGRIMMDLCQDPEISAHFTKLLTTVVSQPTVADATQDLVKATAQTVLTDEKVVSRSKEFVAEVMGDDRLQREGGDALFKSVSHALTPGLYRATGFGLLCASLILAKAVISPF